MKKLFNIFLIFMCFFFLINVKAEETINISSNNAILINLNDDKVIYEKNPDEKVYIASLTKIMTALVSIENISNFDEKILITSDMINDLSYDLSVAGFKSGEVVTYNDLLYGTLLKSGADATQILAISICGSKDEFIKLMNQKAKELNMNNTHFSNTIGIETENHYSTAKDVAILLKYAINNEIFKKIFTTKNYMSTNKKHDMNGPLKMINENGIDYILGAKTGYTSKAGLCLASIAKYDNVNYLLVTIGADHENKMQHIEDSKNIYEYFFNNFRYKKILSKKDILVNLKTIYDEKYTILSKENVEVYLNNSIEKNDLEHVYDGEKILDKTVKKSDKIGTYYIKKDNEILYSKQITSPVDVKMPINYFLKHNIVLIILFLLIIILIPISLMNKKKNNFK